MATTFQIVGHKKSGKTTLLQEFLMDNSLDSFSVIKHTHTPIEVSTNTDTGKFFHYSNDVLLLNDEQTIHYQRHLPTSDLEKIEQLQKTTSADFIVIEGMKELDFPKIVLLKPDETPADFDNITNIKYFATIQGNKSDNVIDIEDEDSRLNFILNFVREIKND
ncbi:molybdopterin-guanine dinucleotide biosynthesis protein MobB [Companilactobacillus hulinensis]|uniref:molybdopterin-guanine dinucleotide biosynthesis protein MobB n=1 Tax=Companilactobacillus hulinensis TaxID=2486007 RepID=UPI000F7ACD0F|nr:molybdopterin-guanine dinucleotide biosynthesis protein MobB [Companilactobacillus hulinensis]